MTSSPLLLAALAVLSLLALASATDDVDIEAVSVDGGEPVVLSRSRRADNIKDVTKDKLTQSDRTQFVKAHNDFRSIVSPQASNMPFMVRDYSDPIVLILFHCLCISLVSLSLSLSLIQKRPDFRRFPGESQNKLSVKHSARACLCTRKYTKLLNLFFPLYLSLSLAVSTTQCLSM